MRSLIAVILQILFVPFAFPVTMLAFVVFLVNHFLFWMETQDVETAARCAWEDAQQEWEDVAYDLWPTMEDEDE
jgi:hypothetical protein